MAKKPLIIRLVLIFIGIISLTLAIFGIILPILPTTPFLLLTAVCFSGGSIRFHNWFLSTNLYKKHLDNFVRNKSMTKKSKIILLSTVSIMLIITMIIVNNLIVTIVISVLIIFKYLYFILCIKTIK